jgi:hypothetical protein
MSKRGVVREKMVRKELGKKKQINVKELNKIEI